MRPKMLFFDVGETLVSEERLWTSWAEWLQVPAGAFFAAMGAVIERRSDYREVFSYFRSDFDLTREREERAKAGLPFGFLASDIFPDTVPTLRWARAQGYRLGFGGNHSRATEDFLQELDVDVEIVGSAECWGVSKPDPRFFETISGNRFSIRRTSPISGTGSTTTFSRLSPSACRPSMWSADRGASFRRNGPKPRASG